MNLFPFPLAARLQASGCQRQTRLRRPASTWAHSASGRPLLPRRAQRPPPPLPAARERLIRRGPPYRHVFSAYASYADCSQITLRVCERHLQLCGTHMDRDSAVAREAVHVARDLRVHPRALQLHCRECAQLGGARSSLVLSSRAKPATKS